jgi:hypothetical protein
MARKKKDSSYEEPTEGRRHGNSTSKRAARMLVRLKQGYIEPTAKQKKRILLAFAKRGRAVYGRAYDIVRIHANVSIDLNDQASIDDGLDSLILYEIKSTRRKTVGPDFDNYFFALTTAELLVAQSLKEQFRFIFVNVVNKQHKELTLMEVLAKARGFYPQWSISF